MEGTVAERQGQGRTLGTDGLRAQRCAEQAERSLPAGEGCQAHSCPQSALLAEPTLSLLAASTQIPPLLLTCLLLPPYPTGACLSRQHRPPSSCPHARRRPPAYRLPPARRCPPAPGTCPTAHVTPPGVNPPGTACGPRGRSPPSPQRPPPQRVPSCPSLPAAPIPPGAHLPAAGCRGRPRRGA